jgi:hypothetical protein
MQILHKTTGTVLFSANVQTMRELVELAVKNKVDLRWANEKNNSSLEHLLPVY